MGIISKNLISFCIKREINKLLEPYPISTHIEEIRTEGQWENLSGGDAKPNEHMPAPRNGPLYLYPLTVEEIAEGMLQTPLMLNNTPKKSKHNK